MSQETKKLKAHRHTPDTQTFYLSADGTCITFRCVCGKEGIVVFDPIWGNEGVVECWKQKGT